MLQRNIDPLSRPFDDVFEQWHRQYRRGRAIRVNFRDIVGNSSASERFTHRFHPYPAKLLLNIPLFFLNCSQLIKSEGVVYDPFCGSGTVLVESMVRGVRSIGADSNPLARLISHAKTTILDEETLEAELKEILSTIPQRGAPAPGGPIHLERWFSAEVLLQLCRLRDALSCLPEGPSKTFFLVCFSSLISRVSLADPTVPVPVIINPRRRSLTPAQRKLRRTWVTERSTANVFELFEDIARANIGRLKRLGEHVHSVNTLPILGDARLPHQASSIDLVITSPPYASAQKYVRASSLSLQWLGLAPRGLRAIEKQSIGREHFSRDELDEVALVPKSAKRLLDEVGKTNPLRKHIAATYLFEMHNALKTTANAVRCGGHVVLIVGNNTVCGLCFDTQKYLTEICGGLNLELLFRLEDRIHSRGLITKRHASGGLISKETILIFKKV